MLSTYVIFIVAVVITGEQLPEGFIAPVIGAAKPPILRFSSPGVIVLGVEVPETDAPTIECEIWINDGAGGATYTMYWRGLCVENIRVSPLLTDEEYSFKMRVIAYKPHVQSATTYSFEGDFSLPLTAISAGVPLWEAARPSILALGTQMIRISWLTPNEQGSPILDYTIDMSIVAEGYNTTRVYNGTGESTVLQYIVSGLMFGLTYHFDLYAINRVGISLSTRGTYTVAHEKQLDRSNVTTPMPHAVRSGAEDFIIIHAAHNVTFIPETHSTSRLFVASLVDGCTMNPTNTMCLRLPQGHDKYEPNKGANQCCMQSIGMENGLYQLPFTGTAAGRFSLLVQSLEQGGLLVQMWTNRKFTGDPLLTSKFPINLDGTQAKVSEYEAKFVAARWTGFILTDYAEEYTFYLESTPYAMKYLGRIHAE